MALADAKSEGDAEKEAQVAQVAGAEEQNAAETKATHQEKPVAKTKVHA